MLATAEELETATLRRLPFTPTDIQHRLVSTLSKFVIHHKETDAYILNGYAGSGKTSIISALVRGMLSYHIKCVLMAPTGRAAKVLSEYGDGIKATTIHKRIYRGNGPDPVAREFVLARNNDHDTIFIVDEASMVTDGGDERRSVLRHLVEYVYSGDNCALILVGDRAQLPPPGEAVSAAMSPSVLKSLGLRPFGTTLETPMRQREGSGILYNATLIREELERDSDRGNLKFRFGGFSDFKNILPIDFADELSTSWAEVGKEETLIITRSNRIANVCNRDVRNRVLYADEALMRGERLVISKNDYFWGKKNKGRELIANGETAIVEYIGQTENRYGLQFADVEIRLSSDDSIIGAKLLLDSLECDGPSLPRFEMERLYNNVLQDYTEGELSTRMRKAADDPYFNALQAKYAYCVTCHKAQGGEWKHIYIDMGSLAVTPETYTEFLRWLYTALTRATEKVVLVGSRLPSDVENGW